eukprot:1060152-Pyramimonas_sp.AAC.1
MPGRNQRALTCSEKPISHRGDGRPVRHDRYRARGVGVTSRRPGFGRFAGGGPPQRGGLEGV